MRMIAPVVALVSCCWSAWTPVPTSSFSGAVWDISTLSKGWTGLCNGVPYVSNDRGRSWISARNGLPSDVFLMRARQMRDTVIAFGSGTFWRSVDFGVNWTRWDEGYVPGPLSLDNFSFEVGDTTCIMMTKTETGTVVWRRTPGTVWKRITSPDSLETYATWTGKSFVGRDRATGVVMLSPSDSVWRPAPDGYPALRLAIWHKGKRWAVSANNGIFSSSDSGATWTKRQRYDGWIDYLASSSEGIIGIKRSSMILVRTGDTVDVSVLPQPETYGLGFVEDGTRWFFLGEQATWISDDAAAHWTRGGVPGAGRVTRMVATSQGLLRQDEFDPTKAYLLKDMSTWSKFALPDGTLNGGIDTAAGTLFAIGVGRIWTHGQNGWSMDSMERFQSSLTASIASDGKKLWIINDGVLYSRSSLSRTWSIVDTMAAPFKPDAMRFWNGTLWAVTYVNYGMTSDLPVASTSVESVRWTKVPITCGNAYVLAPSPEALWIGTDKGLFRTRDGARFERIVADSALPEGHAFFLAVQGDTVAVSMLSSEIALYDGGLSTSVSIDGGKTWSTSGDLALSLAFTPTGLVAGMFKGGLWRWTSRSDAVERTPAHRRDFAWRPGRLEWNASDARSLEILDAQGRILSRVDVAPGTYGIALPPASTLRIARLTGPSGSRTIAVPPLR